MTKREANRGVRQINHIALAHDRRHDLEVLALTLDLERNTTEAARGTNLVDVLRTRDDHAQAVGVLKGCPVLINRRATSVGRDRLDDTVDHILGVNLVG